MSLLPSTSHANPTTPFWEYAGGGGGVSLISSANDNLLVSSPSGSVTLTSVIPYTRIAEPVYDQTGGGILTGGVYILGSVDPSIFFPAENHFYTVGLTVDVKNIASTPSSFDGNLEVRMVYTDGVNTYYATQTVIVNHTHDNSYKYNVSIGFKYVTAGVLQIEIVNNTGEDIDGFDWSISSLYSIDLGTNGDIGLAPIFPP